MIPWTDLVFDTLDLDGFPLSSSWILDDLLAMIPLQRFVSCVRLSPSVSSVEDRQDRAVRLDAAVAPVDECWNE